VDEVTLVKSPNREGLWPGQMEEEDDACEEPKVLDTPPSTALFAWSELFSWHGVSSLVLGNLDIWTLTRIDLLRAGV
jgi:hypothetical protein